MATPNIYAKIWSYPISQPSVHSPMFLLAAPPIML